MATRPPPKKKVPPRETRSQAREGEAVARTLAAVAARLARIERLASGLERRAARLEQELLEVPPPRTLPGARPPEGRIATQRGRVAESGAAPEVPGEARCPGCSLRSSEPLARCPYCGFLFSVLPPSRRPGWIPKGARRPAGRAETAFPLTATHADR